jgi:quercetin dioxygenase-like cupin family protein
MNLRDKVKKEGGVFNLYNGDYTWTTPEGLTSHIVLTPRVGVANVNMGMGVHKPGQGMAPHVHPLSEEILIIYRGKGEVYLKDKWIPVEAGDIVYAPAGVYHGTRNPATNTEDFETIGCGAPPQLDLYQRAGYDPLADDK